LWHRRRSLFLRSKHLYEDKRLMVVWRFEHMGQ
jgi:hypothetical protein